MDYNIALTVIRTTTDGETRRTMNAIDNDNSYLLPVDADIEEGDRVEQILPSGRTRTVYVTKVDVRQSPFGDDDLDHTEAHYISAAPAPPAAAAGSTTVNVNATNVQVATGPHAHQEMTVGATTDHLVDLIKGIAELTALSGAADGFQDDLNRARDAAITQVQSSGTETGAVQRFAEWVSDRVKEGAGTAVSAAIGAAISGLIQDVEALARTITS